MEQEIEKFKSEVVKINQRVKEFLWNAKNWIKIVEIASPAMPKAGINKNPKMNIGFNKILAKRPTISTFL